MNALTPHLPALQVIVPMLMAPFLVLLLRAWVAVGRRDCHEPAGVRHRRSS